MTQSKWVTLSVTEEELRWLDEARLKMEKTLGLRLSRNAFVKRLLFASVLVEKPEEGKGPLRNSKAVQTPSTASISKVESA